MNSSESGNSLAASERLIEPPSPSRQILTPSFFVGTLTGLGIGAGYEFSSAFRQVDIKAFLIGSAALGATFAAIIIAVLALVSVWFDDTYERVLKRRGGWVTAMRPFRIVANVSILATLAATVGLFLLGVHQVWPKALILAITGWLLSWMLFETNVVVALLFEHGRDRAELAQRLRERRIAEGIPPPGR